MKYKKELFLIILLSFFLHGYSLNITFTKQPSEQVSLEGFNVLFECAAVSSPAKAITYLWKFNGNFINTNRKRRFNIRNGGALSLNGVLTEDFGVYQCVAQCPDGAIISQYAKLTKAYFGVSGSTSGNTYRKKEGAFLLIKAPTITSKPAARLTWQLCKQSNCNSDKSRIFTTSTGDLLIPSLLRTDNQRTVKLTVSAEFFRTQEFTLGTIYITENLHRSQMCPDNTLEFLTTQRNFTIHEGQNASLDCLAVQRRCGIPLSYVGWKKDQNTISGSANVQRRLQLINVQRQDEGEYICEVISTAGTNTASYYVSVIEKPKLISEPPKTLFLSSNGIVPSGTVQGAESVEWYTNAERIAGTSDYYQILKNNSLQIKFLSTSLSGIYQIFYQNNAGMISRTINVNIRNDICGGKLTSSNGHIDFFNVQGLSSGLIQCVWLIQTPKSRLIQLNVTNFSLKNSDCNVTKLEIFEGLVTSNVSNRYRYCSTKHPQEGLVMAGPYITVSLTANGRQLSNGGFNVTFRYNERIATTPASTTLITNATSARTTTKPQTNATTKSHPKTTTKTTQVITNATSATKSPTPNVTQSSSSSTNGTPHSTKNPHSSTKPNVDPTKTPTTSATTKPKNKDDSAAKNAPTKAGADGITFGVIGAAVGALFVIVVVLGIFFYKKRNAKSPLSFVSKEMAIIESNGPKNNYNNGKFTRKSTSKCPMLDYDGMLPANETCFTLRGSAAEERFISRQRFPDVVPTKGSFDMGYLGPGSNAIREEEYAYISNDGNGTLIGGGSQKNGSSIPRRQPQMEHNYAVLEQDGSNQYQPLMSTSSLSSNSSIHKSHESLALDSLSSCNSPLYHMVEKDDAIQTGNNNVATANPAEPTYHVLDNENRAEPVYKDLDGSNPTTSADLPRGETEVDASSTEYLQPVQPMYPSNKTSSREGSINHPHSSHNQQPVEQEPVYHMLEEEIKKPQFHAPTDIVEPVQGDHRSTLKTKNNTVNAPRDTYQPLTLPSSNKQKSIVGSNSQKISQPITESDNVYQPIITDDTSRDPSTANNSREENFYNQSYQALEGVANSNIYQPLS